MRCGRPTPPGRSARASDGTASAGGGAVARAFLNRRSYGWRAGPRPSGVAVGGRRRNFAPPTDRLVPGDSAPPEVLGAQAQAVLNLGGCPPGSTAAPNTDAPATCPGKAASGGYRAGRSRHRPHRRRRPHQRWPRPRGGGAYRIPKRGRGSPPGPAPSRRACPGRLRARPGLANVGIRLGVGARRSGIGAGQAVRAGGPQSPAPAARASRVSKQASRARQSSPGSPPQAPGPQNSGSLLGEATHVQERVGRHGRVARAVQLRAREAGARIRAQRCTSG